MNLCHNVLKLSIVLFELLYELLFDELTYSILFVFFFVKNL